MALQYIEDQSGMARWEEPNGSTIEFRAADGTKVTFHAYKSSSFFVRTKIGAEIQTRGLDFVRARIDSRYYLQTHQQVYQVYVDNDSDSNDDYLDEYEQRIIMGALPVRVESLCRVQWHDVRLSAVVRYGDPVFNIGVIPDFPTGWPEGWPPLPVEGYLRVSPKTLELTSRRVGTAVQGKVVVQAFEAAQTVAVSGSPSPRFQVLNTGRTLIQAGARHTIEVRFSPIAKEVVEASFTIETEKGDVPVKLVGKVSDAPVLHR